MDSPIEIPQDFLCEKCQKPREAGREHWALCRACQDTRDFEDACDSLKRYGSTPSRRLIFLIEATGCLIDDEAHGRPPSEWVVTKLFGALVKISKEAK